MTRTEWLKEIIALEEAREEQTRQFDALGREIRKLYAILPSENPRKNHPGYGMNRVQILKEILAAEKQREAAAALLLETKKCLKALQRAMPHEPTVQGLKHRRHGELRQLLLDALREAGSEGVRIAAYCKRSGLSGNHVRAALSEYLKTNTMPGLSRIAPGHYRLTGNGER